MHLPAKARLWLFLVLMDVAGTAFAQKAAKPAPAPAPLPPPSPETREIYPPFSLMWHEPSERLEAKVDAAKLTITGRKKIEGRWVLTAEGFKKPNPADPSAPKPPELRRVLFHFDGGGIS